MNRVPLARDLVLVGGGHTHILFLKKFAMNPIEGLDYSGQSGDRDLLRHDSRLHCGALRSGRGSDKFESPCRSLAQTS